MRCLILGVLGSLPAGVGLGDVHISEIHYNPAGEDGRDLEYVEIHNSGAAAVDLSAWRFTDGIQFEFPAGTILAAGGYLVVAASVSDLLSAYPQVDPALVVGDFVGNLDGGGELLILGGREMLRYDDDPPWDFLADGFGASLERLCFNAPPGVAENWRSSRLPADGTYGGTPGAPRAGGSVCPPPAAVVRPPVFVSEILYHPVREESIEDVHEFIEIHNAGEEAVSLEGWRIAGGVDFTFPAGAEIAAGGYAVIARDRARVGPLYAIDESVLYGDYDRTLDNGGERVVLLDPSGQGVDAVRYDDDPPWPVAADALGAGDDFLTNDAYLPIDAHQHKGFSLERISFEVPAKDVANWALSPLDGATPGRANAAASSTLPTIVDSIDVTPIGSEEALIRQEDEVRIALFFAPAGLGGAAAQIEYFVDDLEVEDEPTVMVDLRHGEQDEYFTTLPPQPDNSIVRYRVWADRGAGLEVLSPRASDPFAWHAYFVSPRIDTETPVYQTFISLANWGQMYRNVQSGRASGCNISRTWDLQVPAVFVHEGRVHDVSVRYQGSRWNRTNGVNLSRWPGPRPVGSPLVALSWRIEFPRYNQQQGRNVIILNKLTQGCPGYNAGVGYRLFEMAGIPGSRSQFVRHHLNGHYYHYMFDLERGGEDMIRRWNAEQAALHPDEPREPIGHLYKSSGFNGDEGPWGWGDWRPLQPRCDFTEEDRYAATYDRKTHQWAGYDDFIALIEGLAAARREGVDAIRVFIEENFDFEKLINYIAVMNYSVPFDDMFQNHFIYQRVSDGKWFLIPWDLDQNFGQWQGANSSIYMGEAGDPSNRSGWKHDLKDAFLKAFRTEYEDRLLELNNTILHPDVIALLVDEVTAKANPAEAAMAPGGIACSFPGRENSFKQFAQQRFEIINSRIAGVELDAGSNQVVFAGSTVQFDARESTPEPDEETVYGWSNGMEGNFPTFTYDEPGTYEVTLTVEKRGVVFTDSVEIEVLAVPEKIFLEQGGEVTIEAESFFENKRRDSEAVWWDADTAVAGFSGSGYMGARSTERETFSTSSYTEEAPELRYAIRFSNPGTYRLWMRAFVPSSREDQFFVGFNSENRGSGYEQRFEVDASGFGWSGDSRTKGPQLFEVTEPGIYLFSIWIKESGTIADKILLTRDQDFVPTGMGGAESPTGGGPPASAFVRGDANRNGGVDLSDGIAILQYLFTGSSPLVCEDHGDVDDNGRLETADALRLVEFLFLEGAPPAAPFPDPGLDPTTGDAHGCGDR